MKQVKVFALLIPLAIILSSCAKTTTNSGPSTTALSDYSSSRGINVVEIKTSEGKALDLYRGSYALVIGNGNYTNGWDKLSGAVQDVSEVAKALDNYGFNVTLKTNLTREKFSQALNEFSIKYGRNEDNQLLIYYAGHGYTEKLANDEDLGYLVMVDAPSPDEDPLGFSNRAVDMQSIVTKAKQIRARHVLFMFDSCFSGTLLSMRDKVVPKAISDSVKYPVRQFITAGRANEKVPDHSVFKQAFLDLLEGRDKEPIPDGYITGEELGLYLKNKVPEYNPSQNPQYGKIRDPKLDKGDFVFGFNTATRWSSKQKALEDELKHLEAEAKKAETEARELEAKKKSKELERRIEEARRKKEEAERKISNTKQKIVEYNDNTKRTKKKRKWWEAEEKTQDTYNNKKLKWWQK